MSQEPVPVSRGGLRGQLSLPAVIAGLATAALLTAGPASGLSSQVCQNLKATPSVLSSWQRVFVKHGGLAGVKLKRPTDVDYGRCGYTEYGRASFDAVSLKGLTTRQQRAFQDQPDVYKRGADSTVFKIIGNSGGGVPCNEQFGYPRELVKIWHLRCT